MKTLDYQVELSDLEPLFVTGYYDFPLKGFRLTDGHVTTFKVAEAHGPDIWYSLRSLAWHQEIVALLLQALFDFCIGTYWSANDWSDVHMHRDRAQWLRVLQARFYTQIAAPLLAPIVPYPDDDDD